MIPSCATFADKAFKRRWKVCRSCRSQIVRTPAGDTTIARFLSSLATRTWPNAGCSSAKRHHRLFDAGVSAILEIRLLARNLRQRRLPARLVQLLEPIEAVPTEPEHLARLGHAAQRLRQLQQSELVLDNLLFLRHLTSPVS